jgi:hypothetical protein
MKHISYHTGALNSGCVLYNHNAIENDVRAHFLNVFGTGPSFAINGDLLSTNTNYSSASIFQPYSYEMTPLSINGQLTQIGFDSVEIQVWVKTEAANGLSMQKLFVMLAEDTVFYSAPNGESEHYNVFRKMMFDTSGVSFMPAITEGDFVSFTSKVAVHPDWDLSRIYPVIFVEDTATGLLTQSIALNANLMANPGAGVEVPKKIVVEHFTNSRCSVCASRNPGFYANYNTSNSGDMIHLTVHLRSRSYHYLGYKKIGMD